MSLLECWYDGLFACLFHVQSMPFVSVFGTTCRLVWNDLTFGLERLDVWFGTTCRLVWNDLSFGLE